MSIKIALDTLDAANLDLILYVNSVKQFRLEDLVNMKASIIVKMNCICKDREIIGIKKELNAYLREKYPEIFTDETNNIELVVREALHLCLKIIEKLSLISNYVNLLKFYYGLKRTKRPNVINLSNVLNRRTNELVGTFRDTIGFRDFVRLLAKRKHCEKYVRSIEGRRNENFDFLN